MTWTNYGSEAVEFELELRFEGDFADLFDVKEQRLVRRGSIESRWDGETRTLTTSYRHGDFERGLAPGVQSTAPSRSTRTGCSRFGSRSSRRIAGTPACSGCRSARAEQEGGPIEACHALLTGDPELAKRRRAWLARVTRIETNDSGVNAVVERALDDLGVAAHASRRQGRHCARGDGIEERCRRAGIPWFVSLFGRDALVVSLQTLSLSPGPRRGQLAGARLAAGGPLHGPPRSAAGQDRARVSPRGARPLRARPQDAVLRHHDATTLYVWAAAELWRWTANRALLERLKPTRRTRRFIGSTSTATSDGDGLQEYQTRAGDWGYYNQSWKDSGDGHRQTRTARTRSCRSRPASCRATSSPPNAAGPTPSNRRSTTLLAQRSCARQADPAHGCARGAVLVGG